MEGTDPPAAAAVVVVEGMEAEGMEVVGTVLPLVGRRRLPSTRTSSREGMALVGMELAPLLLLRDSKEAGMELVATELADMEQAAVLLVVGVHLVRVTANLSALRLSMTLRDLPLELTFSYGSEYIAENPPRSSMLAHTSGPFLTPISDGSSP